MNLQDIVGRGYLPKELVPPFNSQKYANVIDSVLSAWELIFINKTNHKGSDLGLTSDISNGESKASFKERKKALATQFISKYSSSSSTTFSISKGKLSRRYLEIPNPKHFGLLCKKLSENWIEINNIFSLSEFSTSCPIPNSDPLKRSVTTKCPDVSNFRKQLLLKSFNKTIEIRIDISKFYPSIYTHTITWALLGKEDAKLYFEQKDNIKSLISSGDTKAKLYNIGDEIDNAIRACQARQSIGIPIGPDSSHIIAELIASRIDYNLKAEFSFLNIKSCRYFDDYYIYVSSKDEADKVVKGLQRNLVEYRLEINESKLKIREFPFAFEDEFTSLIHQFTFKKTNIENSIRHYFSLIWELAEKHPSKSDTIFKYALKTFENLSIEIPKSCWNIFEALLIKSAIIEPAILEIVNRILLSYSTYIDTTSKEHLTELINIVIGTHTALKHNQEVSWALWLAKTFNIEISEEKANLIIESRDSISILILLDISKNSSLVKGFPKWSLIEADLKGNILFSDQWILAYEAVKKGWLMPSETNLLENNYFFKLLKDADVEFYDENRQLSFKTLANKVVEVDAGELSSEVTQNHNLTLAEFSNDNDSNSSSVEMTEYITWADISNLI